ncbi:DUF3631 domain-containing protein [Sinorhizobium meliloti]|nr:DUF3631 domain-containing protein [Sinorhizobium meliloti]
MRCNMTDRSSHKAPARSRVPGHAKTPPHRDRRHRSPRQRTRQLRTGAAHRHGRCRPLPATDDRRAHAALPRPRPACQRPGRLRASAFGRGARLIDHLKLALRYALDFNMMVLPVDPGTKRALTKNWTNTKSGAAPGSSRDEQTIREWWWQFPKAIVGLRCGSENGVVCIDVDQHGKTNGFPAFKALGIHHDDTPVVMTPTGGWHVWFAYPGKVSTTVPSPGLEIRGDGAMTIAPECYRDGKPYSYVNGVRFPDLAPLPNEVLALLRRSKTQLKLDGYARQVENTPEGQRHEVLRKATMALAYDVAEGRLPETEYRERMIAMAGLCKPPFPRLDTEALIDGALAKAKGRGTTGGKSEGGRKTFVLPEIEPAEDEVIGEEVLDDLVAVLCEYVVFPSRVHAELVALWIMHTHFFPAGDYTPRLLIRSPTRRCGKSRLLDVIGKLTPRALRAVNITPAFFFRAVDQLKPTVLLDELDKIPFDEKRELLAALNAGITPDNPFGRVQGEDKEIVLFNVFAPAVLAGQSKWGTLPDDLVDRSIAIDLARKRRDVDVSRFERHNVGHLVELSRRCARFAIDNHDAVARCDPDIPGVLNDREADGWRVLLAIAETAGGEWVERGRRAARALAQTDEAEDVDVAVRLLADCKAVFDIKQSATLLSHELLSGLLSLPDSEWTEYGPRLQSITAVGVSRLLRAFGIIPKLTGETRRRGYRRMDLEQAWEVYL